MSALQAKVVFCNKAAAPAARRVAVVARAEVLAGVVCRSGAVDSRRQRPLSRALLPRVRRRGAAPGGALARRTFGRRQPATRAASLRGQSARKLCGDPDRSPPPDRALADARAVCRRRTVARRSPGSRPSLRSSLPSPPRPRTATPPTCSVARLARPVRPRDPATLIAAPRLLAHSAPLALHARSGDRLSVCGAEAVSFSSTPSTQQGTRTHARTLGLSHSAHLARVAAPYHLSTPQASSRTPATASRCCCPASTTRRRRRTSTMWCCVTRTTATR